MENAKFITSRAPPNPPKHPVFWLRGPKVRLTQPAMAQQFGTMPPPVMFVGLRTRGSIDISTITWICLRNQQQ